MALTVHAVDQGRPLLLLFLLLLRRCAVLAVHLADRGGPLALHLGVKLLVEKHLVHWVGLHGAGLGGGFGRPVVVPWVPTGDKLSLDSEEQAPNRGMGTSY